MKLSSSIAACCLFCTFLGCQVPVEVQDNRFVFLVRHAEKVDESKDAPLSIEGIERAIRLKDILLDSEIEHIYSTGFQRTKNTVKPLADDRQLEIETYSVDTLWEFSQHILKNGSGNILISGHSNSIPNLANLLLGNEKYEEFQHEEYGNIIIINILDMKVTGSFTIKY